jgi:hypothetical protein
MKLISEDRRSEIAATKETLPVVTNRQCRAYFHGTLRGRSFFIVFGLFKKIHGRFVVVVFQKIGRFVETHPTGRARRIDIPRSRNVLGLFTCFVRHRSLCTQTRISAQSLCEKTSCEHCRGARRGGHRTFIDRRLAQAPLQIMGRDIFDCAQSRLRGSKIKERRFLKRPF